MRPLPLPFPVSSFDVDLCWQLRPEDSAAQQWLCDTIARTVSGACVSHPEKSLGVRRKSWTPDIGWPDA